MHDPASPQPSPSNPEVEAIEIVGETTRELVAAAEQLPAQPERAEALARVFDRLSEDLAEAAKLIRQAAARTERFMP
jgi:hypothetical protein